MKGFANEDHNQRMHIASLRLALIGTWLLVIVVLLVHFWGLRHLKVEIPPDLRSGATVEVGKTYPPTAYNFAYVVWQQLYLWREDGDREYLANIQRLSPYLTPRCGAELRADHTRRRSGGALNELANRSRNMIPVGIQIYTPEKVRVLGPGLFEVTLDFQVYETHRGVPVKDDLFLRYRLRVVEHDVDSELNPWGIALDCHGRRPEPIPPSQRKERP